MILSEMKTALKRYGFDDSDPLTTWINWGMHDLEHDQKWTFLAGLTSVNTVIGTSTLSLGTTIGSIVSAKINGDSDPLDFLPPSAFMRNIADFTVSGHPSQYTRLSSGVIKLYPVPDAVYAVTFFYRGQELDLADASPGGTPLYIPSDMHHLIVIKAAAYGLQAENEEQRAQDALSQYTAGVSSVLAKYTDTTDEPREVQDVMNYGD